MRALTVALVCLVTLAAPTAASAATQTVTFSELGLPENTTILDQYAGAPYLVSFGNPERFGFPAPPPLLNCGSPYLQNNALSGTALGIACRTGSNEFPDRRFATAMEFQNEQRTVAFNMVNRTAHQQTAVIKFYAIGSNTPLTTLTHVLPPNQIDAVTYTAPDNRIIGAVVQGLEAMDYSDSGGVFIDDLAMSRDAQALTPKFTVAVQTPSAEVVEGSTVDVPVSVRRYNGSTGSVTLSVGPLPSKVESTQFLPNASATGTNPVTLRIRSKRPNTETQQLSVNGAPAIGSAGVYANSSDPTVSVTGIAAVYFATGGRFPLRLVPGCGPQTIKDSFNVRGDFSGYMGFNFGVRTGGVTGTTKSAPYASGNGTYPLEYSLDPGAGDGSGSVGLDLHPYGATDASITLNWISDRLAIKSAAPQAPALPLVDGGSTVSLTGNFPAGCPVTFKDASGQDWPVRTKDATEVDGRQYDLYTLNVPKYGVSGPIRALNAAGTEMARTSPIDVREFRRTYGLSLSNSSKEGGKGTYSWADFERTFGDDDVEACFIVCVHDPIASDYYDKFKADVEAGGGLCFGYATMALRFRGYGSNQRFSDYQAGATRAWDIAPTSDGTAIKRDIVRWYTAQFDKGYQKGLETATSRSAGDERTLLKDLINQAGGALVSIRQGGSGHAVVAYAVQDTPAGGVQLSIYDSNIPYTTSEETVANAHRDAMTRGGIAIDAAGNWTEGNLSWMGNNSTLKVSANIPPDDAKLPNDFSLASVFSSSGGAAPVQIKGIESGGKSLIDTDGEPVDGSGIKLTPSLSGAGAEPTYQLKKGRQYDLTIRGSKSGPYDHSLLAGDAHASVRGADTKAGQIDHVIVRPGEASLRFATGASNSAVAYDLVAKSGKATRTATVAVTAHEGGEDETELGGGVLRMRHDGAPTKASVTLGSVGEGLPGTVQTAPLAVGRDQRLELRPRSWSNLTDGVAYTVRAKNGRVVRRGTARLRTSTRVAVGGVKAKRKGKKLTVTGRVTKRGASPLLIASATIVKGGRTVRRKAASLAGAKVRKGRFSLPLAIGSVPAGARITVDVILLDQSAGLATARRSVRVR